MKTYGVNIRKYDPWRKRGKNYYAEGYTATEMKILEQTEKKPDLVTPEYIDYLIEKYKLKKTKIDDNIKKLKRIKKRIKWPAIK